MNFKAQISRQVYISLRYTLNNTFSSFVFHNGSLHTIFIYTDNFLPHVIKRSLLYLGPQRVHVLSVFCEKLWSADFKAGISPGYTSIHSLNCLPWFTIAVYIQYLCIQTAFCLML